MFKTGLKGMVALAVIAGAAFIAYNLFGIPYSYSDGERSGIVYKISEKGLMIKTWEGEMNVGIAGAADESHNTATAMRTWEFSVGDDDIAKQIEAAASKGGRITLHYKEPLVMGAWFGKTKYLVTGINAQ
jgi:hypothetical protein